MSDFPHFNVNESKCRFDTRDGAREYQSITSCARKDVSSMIIKSSNVSMNSQRNYEKETITSINTTTALLSRKNLLGKGKLGPKLHQHGHPNATLTISEESQKMMERLRQLQREERQKQFSRSEESNLVSAEEGASDKTEDDVILETLREILKTLKDVQNSFGRGRHPVTRHQFDMYDFSKKLSKDLDSFLKGYNGITNKSMGIGPRPEMNVGVGMRGGVNGLWVKQTVASSFMSETENTAFTSVGNVQTADGRSIDFGITVEMSRSFMEKNEFVSEEAAYIFTDPLVINLKNSPASVSDQKFLFDIDADGKEDNISFLNEGSGFLSLDKNGDGVINDGNELFGTKSGDGFKDLAAYDKDHNGWIDEADDVFKQLKIWTKDAEGNDSLIDLKTAGVGALFLGNVSTQFSLNNMETNDTNAMIRSTGVYLMENGGVGTLQHVDLAV